MEIGTNETKSSRLSTEKKKKGKKIIIKKI